ncbi:unnamed protein product [Caenorhabditis auriculariae]|uniref:Complex I assembly factor TIMMDC1, mitochondrial n=1 Tax=Caenorhabditis auriculariae TaxID=2777116 RepID=A0A8S1HC42_9PELO|nr:unnamed protein product [Caenorhabditis auriculariae]
MTPERSDTAASSWWEWLSWRGRKSLPNKPPDPEILPLPAHSVVASTSKEAEVLEVIPPTNGWERVKALYSGNKMEPDVIERVVRMSFLGGFLMGGATGYAQARQTFEINNVGRKYLSPSDAVKRKFDYAIVRFAKGGFGVGFKCAFISGSIILLTTNLSAYRDRFSSWYFPAISGVLACALHSVGGVFAFPLGVVGSAKAFGLGVSSGLTLSAAVHLYALAVDKTADEAYRMFKREYEKELKAAAAWDARVGELMEREKIMWRQTAVKKLKQIDAEKLAVHDD